MRIRPVVAALAGVTAWLSAGAVLADPDCRCRYDGQYFNAGETVCIVVGGQARQARCGKILNNSAWKFTGEGCPTAEASPFLPVQTARSLRLPNYTPLHH